ncbi:MAG TPA: hypothetical protein VNW97_10625 [Candidatus Saccharimonadales bacterium]|nr:hypothetical protein [Candidatus Saccharimonadales bacterium]
MPIALVIDASVARAAGGEGATYPASKHTRDCLTEVRANGHLLAFSPEIRAEWNRHQSSFARQWRLSMVARRRVRQIDSPRDENLRLRIEKASRNTADWNIVEKDCILIEAAIVCDRVILSLDETARNLFRFCGAKVGEIRTVMWTNPAITEELIIDWIYSGCETEGHRMLGHNVAPAS